MAEDWVRRIRRLVASQSLMLVNAGALSSSALTTAVLGFVYWILAARNFPPEAVGHAAAAIAIIALAGLFGEFGLGSLLVGEMQKPHLRADPKQASAFIWAALWMSLAGGALIGLISISGVAATHLDLGTITAGLPKSLFFVAICAVTSFCLVLDQSLVGLLDAGRQMYRNTVFSVLKIIFLLLLIPFSTGLGREFEIFATWMIAKIISVLQVVPSHNYLGGRAWLAPAFKDIALLRNRFLSHHALNIASQIPGLVMPVVITGLLGAKANAAFYTSWMLLSVALLIPASLTTVLYSVGVKEPSALAGRLKFTMSLCALVAVGATAGFALLGPTILGIFGSAYADQMGPSIRLFGLVVAGMTVKQHYIAVARIDQRLLPATLVMLAAAMLELTLASLGASRGGLWGMTIGLLIALAIETAFMVRTIWSARQDWNAVQEGPLA